MSAFLVGTQALAFMPSQSPTEQGVAGAIKKPGTMNVAGLDSVLVGEASQSLWGASDSMAALPG